MNKKTELKFKKRCCRKKNNITRKSFQLFCEDEYQKIRQECPLHTSIGIFNELSWRWKQLLPKTRKKYDLRVNSNVSERKELEFKSTDLVPGEGKSKIQSKLQNIYYKSLKKQPPILNKVSNTSLDDWATTGSQSGVTSIQSNSAKSASSNPNSSCSYIVPNIFKNPIKRQSNSAKSVSSNFNSSNSDVVSVILQNPIKEQRYLAKSVSSNSNSLRSNIVPIIIKNPIKGMQGNAVTTGYICKKWKQNTARQFPKKRYISMDYFLLNEYSF